MLRSKKLAGERMHGDENAMNLSKPTAGGGRRHAGTAQGGNAMISIQCGMGHSTSLHRHMDALALSSHPAIVRLFHGLYSKLRPAAEQGQPLLVWNMTDRMRIKASAATAWKNVMPAHDDKVMPLHVPTKNVPASEPTEALTPENKRRKA